jgi:phage terminase large subunit
VVVPENKEIYIYDEHYETRMLNCDIADMIKRKGFAKERIRADCAEPKSNDDLRRLGIQRVQASVKGKDSVINGITAIQEYKIFVHPSCTNTIAELSAYCWRKDKQDNGLNEPEDRNNHLMDAMRYAFYDVRFFRPQNPKERRKPTADEYYEKSNGMNATDIKGGWF